MKTLRLLFFVAGLFISSSVVCNAGFFDNLQKAVGQVANGVGGAIHNVAGKIASPVSPSSGASSNSDPGANSSSDTSNPSPLEQLRQLRTSPASKVVPWIQRNFRSSESSCETDTASWWLTLNAQQMNKELQDATTKAQAAKIRSQYAMTAQEATRIARESCYSRIVSLALGEYAKGGTKMPKDPSGISTLLLSDQLRPTAMAKIRQIERIPVVQYNVQANIDQDSFNKMLTLGALFVAAAPKASGCTCTPSLSCTCTSDASANAAMQDPIVQARSGNSSALRKIVAHDPVARALNYLAGYQEDGEGLAFYYPIDEKNDGCTYKSSLSFNSEASEISALTGGASQILLGNLHFKGVDYQNLKIFRETGLNSNGNAYLRYESMIEGTNLRFTCDSSQCGPDGIRKAWSVIARRCSR